MYEKKRPEPPTCPYNPGVVCRVQMFCKKCGWNPEVEKKGAACIGTVPMMAVRHGRKGYGCELNPDYFADSVGYLRAETTEMEQPSLFDLMEQEAV